MADPLVWAPLSLPLSPWGMGLALPSRSWPDVSHTRNEDTSPLLVPSLNNCCGLSPGGQQGPGVGPVRASILRLVWSVWCGEAGHQPADPRPGSMACAPGYSPGREKGGTCSPKPW